MPLRNGIDSIGHYYQWGNAKRYYYHDLRSQLIAREKALKQMRAIKWSEYNK